MRHPITSLLVRLFGLLLITLSVLSFFPAHAASVEIAYFQASSDPVDPNGTVTISWSVTGAHHVEVQWFGKSRAYVIRNHQPLTGSLSVPVSEVEFSGSVITFYLEPKDAHDQYYYQPIVGKKPLTVRLKSALKVNAFTTNPAAVARGGTLTLSWDIAGASRVGITRLTEHGNIFVDSIGSNLSAQGSLSYQIPNHYIQSIPFIIIAYDPAGVNITSTIQVAIICPYTDSLLQKACPVTQQQIQAAYQPFEHGFMFWRGDTHEIYVFYPNKMYKKFPDTWKADETFNTPDLPPSGKIQPIRGFGKVWAAQPEVRRQIGWALAVETGFTTTLETHRGNFGRYPYDYPVFKLPDGRIVSTGSPISQWFFVP